MPTPMTPERLEDRFRFYRAKPHQQQGIRLLHEAIRDGLPPEQVLVEEAPWALAYSQAPLALPPSGGLDPWGGGGEGPGRASNRGAGGGGRFLPAGERPRSGHGGL